MLHTTTLMHALGADQHIKSSICLHRHREQLTYVCRTMEKDRRSPVVDARSLALCEGYSITWHQEEEMGRHWHRSHSRCTAVRPFSKCLWTHLNEANITVCIESAQSIWVTLLHMWLDKRSDPPGEELGNGSGAALTECCPRRGAGEERHGENLTVLKSLGLKESGVQS